jgi:hypothetical protein
MCSGCTLLFCWIYWVAHSLTFCTRAVLDWLVQQGFIYQSNKDHYLPTLDLVAAP